MLIQIPIQNHSSKTGKSTRVLCPFLLENTYCPHLNNLPRTPSFIYHSIQASRATRVLCLMFLDPLLTKWFSRLASKHFRNTWWKIDVLSLCFWSQPPLYFDRQMGWVAYKFRSWGTVALKQIVSTNYIIALPPQELLSSKFLSCHYGLALLLTQEIHTLYLNQPHKLLPVVAILNSKAFHPITNHQAIYLKPLIQSHWDSPPIISPTHKHNFKVRNT